MLYKAFRLLFATAVITLTGCASIVSDSKYQVEISSNPTGAKFEIANEDGEIVNRGVTPDHIMLDAGAGYFDGETYRIIYRKDGYEQKSTLLDSKVDGWYWGNLGFGGIIGMLFVDPLTGAMYKLPRAAHVNLQPSEPPQTAAVSVPSKSADESSRAKLLNELAADKSLSYDEYQRRYNIIMRQP
ncbi:hypothetical protein ACFOJE_20450 [Azotobacter bryophylli]|uniref:PEGA domain-containing protein n=1 Tax=Azotobacter bryophylli TaxID=1986537 RepID=A0ABV7AYV9_9GAMM